MSFELLILQTFEFSTPLDSPTFEFSIFRTPKFKSRNFQSSQTFSNPQILTHSKFQTLRSRNFQISEISSLWTWKFTNLDVSNPFQIPKSSTFKIFQIHIHLTFTIREKSRECWFWKEIRHIRRKGNIEFADGLPAKLSYLSTDEGLLRVSSNSYELNGEFGRRSKPDNSVPLSSRNFSTYSPR